MCTCVEGEVNKDVNTSLVYIYNRCAIGKHECTQDLLSCTGSDSAGGSTVAAVEPDEAAGTLEFRLSIGLRDDLSECFWLH